MKEIKLSEIEGFYIGHAQDYDAVIGCTAIICPEGAVSGVDIRGGGPATRETALLDADKNTHKIHSVVFSGGSAFIHICIIYFIYDFFVLFVLIGFYL